MKHLKHTTALCGVFAVLSLTGIGGARAAPGDLVVRGSGSLIYDNSISGCTFRHDLTVTGATVDARRNNPGRDVDLYEVQVSNLNGTQGYDQSSAYEQQFGWTGATRASTSLSYSAATAAGLDGSNTDLYYSVFDTDATGSQRVVVFQAPIDFAQMRAAGTGCAALAKQIAPPANRAPIADAGPTQIETAGESDSIFTVRLNGSAGSSDPDGDRLTYR
jgi:hypothetical protein